jgi:arylsulfatase A-like enzyme
MKPENQPNILLITSDQQHWSTLGSLNSALHTPSLDRLATQGTTYHRAYCPNPTCSPTRASMITGLYPSQHGCWSLGTRLPEDVPTIGQLLSLAGYRTALVGKAHFQPLRSTPEYPSLEAPPILQDLDFWRKFNGPFYGFDHVELARNHADEALVGQHYAIWMEEQGCHNWRDYFRPPTGNNENQRWRWQIPEAYHYSAWIAERTNAQLEAFSLAHERFFLWASFFDPHPPYLAPEPWDTMYDPTQTTVPQILPSEHENNPLHFQMTQQERPDFSSWQEPGGSAVHGFHSHLFDRQELARDIAVYYGMISLMDKYIGLILDKLEALELTHNTLVIFTSDHGHLFGQHGLIAKGPFHYEDLIRVPFIARWPGVIPAGAQSDALQSLVDLTPSFLRAAGLDIPWRMSGVDQTPVWFGQQSKIREHIIVENRHQPTTVHLKTYVSERYKITVYYGRSEGELFDLQTDPGEQNNLWRFLQAEMGKEPLWMPRITHA